MFWKAVFSLAIVAALSNIFTPGLALGNPVFFYEYGLGRSLSDDEREIHRLVNRERSKMRLRTLEWDNRLAKLARAYSRKMARERFFDHYDRRGNTVMDRADDLRIDGWRKIGENLFVCRGIEDFPAFSVRGWMRSATHRQNVLERAWTATGIGIAEAPDGSIYITQVFVED